MMVKSYSKPNKHVQISLKLTKKERCIDHKGNLLKLASSRKLRYKTLSLKHPPKINLVKVQNGINGIFSFFHAVL